MVVVVLLGNLSPAWAQSATTWLPDFEPGQQVYVDPKLANHPDYPVNFSGLESQLKAAGAEHDLKVYFVATEQGRDIQFEPTPAITALEDLQNRWSSNSNLEKDNYLIVLWVRKPVDVNRGSIAGVGGNNLKAMGLDEHYFSDQSNGPIVPFLRQYMPADPGGLVLNVASEVNDDISEIKFQQMLPTYIGIGIAIALLLGTIGFFHFRFTRRKAKAFALILEWRKKFELANPKYIALKGSYMGMLSERTDWRERLIGRTRVEYEDALTKFALLTARLMAAGKRLEQAEDDFEDARYPSIKMFDAVIAKLTTEKVEVTGKNIPQEEVTLFGDLVESDQYLPPELLEVLEELYEEVNSKLKMIDEAFEGSRKNKRDIEKLMRAVTEIKPQLEKVGLVFTPYEARLAAINKRFDACVEILTSNPVEALDASESIEADSEMLKADLLRAIQIKGSLTGVMTRIEEVEARVSELRTGEASYKYQLAEDESAPQGADEALFKLSAEGGNPDSILLSARDSHAEASTLVYEGKLDEADSARGKAKASAEEADDLMDETLEAKEFVESYVVHARNTAENLTTEIPNGNVSLTSLQDNFLPENIVGYAERMSTAEAVRDDHTFQMSEVKRLYDEQDFLGARNTLTSHQDSIDDSREDIRKTHAWLKTITKYRSDSRDTADRLEEMVGDLVIKLARNSFTTSATTDDRFETAQAQVEEFSAETAKAVADWPKLVKATVEVEKELESIDQAIDSEKTSHARAKSAVATAKQALANANAYFTNGYVRQGAVSKRDEARTAVKAVKRTLGTAKSDWAQLKRDAQSAEKLANEAKKKAKADIAAAEAADSAIDSAETLINQLGYKSYGEGVSANLSSANTALRQARSYFRSSDYENAKKYAKSAYKKADDADDDAEDKVDSIRRKRRQKAAAAAAKTTTNFKIGGGTGGRRTGGGGGRPARRAGGGNYRSTGVGGGNY